MYFSRSVTQRIRVCNRMLTPTSCYRPVDILLCKSKVRPKKKYARRGLDHTYNATHRRLLLASSSVDGCDERLNLCRVVNQSLLAIVNIVGSAVVA